MASQSQVERMELILGTGVPADSLAFYGRWFQFETWLREVAYVELRAKYGKDWVKHLEGSAPGRARRDVRNSYMASADADDLVAYADVFDLFNLIASQWSLFEDFLLPQERWLGRVDELRQLRNRNAHCRRPHRDDVARIEQTLRDLESGASSFYRSYLDTYNLELSDGDPLVKAWVEGAHPTAARLLRHAERQYDVRFRLRASIRPWAERPALPGRLSGRDGVVWHAQWILGDWEVSPRALWTDVHDLAGVEDLIIHLLFDVATVTATFSAVDAHEDIADAVGAVFDGILRDGMRRRGADLDEAVGREEARLAEVADLPARVQANSTLTHFDPLLTNNGAIFAA
jgi:hypothetical protein